MSRLSPFLAGVLALAALLVPATASASPPPTPKATITAGGNALNKIFVGNELGCQVARGVTYQLFPNDAAPGDCGTLVLDGSALYGPSFAAHGHTATNNANLVPTAFSTVSQSAVSGSGTSNDPYKVVTVVNAGTKLRLTQTDT